MSTAALAVPSLADAPEAEARRPRVLFVASAIAAGASGLVVIAMLSVYLQVRGDLLESGSAVFPEGTVIPLTPGNMGLATLALSVVTMAWAVYSLRNDDRPHAYMALGLTLLFGVAFINSTVYLYQQVAMPFSASGTSALFYVVTGGHLAMLIVGMLFVAVMGFQALGGELTGRDAEGMSAAALYWHVTCAVYIAVWYAIYITK
jgi:heme/copper-type cytochrome/quinol oxidase subunit 3